MKHVSKDAMSYQLIFKSVFYDIFTNKKGEKADESFMLEQFLSANTSFKDKKFKSIMNKVKFFFIRNILL